MKRLYYLINTYPKEGTTVTRCEYIEIDENGENFFEIIDKTEKKPGFQEWCE